jgi:ferredoxin--NADP+ reductase
VYPIVRAETIAPGLSRLDVLAPAVARRRQAGQFVIVRAHVHGERIPLTIVDASPDEGTVALVVQAVGASTRLIAGLRAGDALVDLAGPLGNPTPLVENARVACVGGGVGAAEVLPIARALFARGNRIDTVLGARTRELVVLEDELARTSATLVVTTDDGTYGRAGRVVDPLRERLADGAGWDAVYAVGPLPMMKAVAELTRPHAIRTIVSVNALMIDGTGMCGGCRLTVGGAVRFACVDGPEFDAHAVDFDELIRRGGAYRTQERMAEHACRGAQP